MKLYFVPTKEVPVGEFWFFTELVILTGTDENNPKEITDKDKRSERLMKSFPDNVFEYVKPEDRPEKIEPEIDEVIESVDEGIEPEIVENKAEEVPEEVISEPELTKEDAEKAMAEIDEEIENVIKDMEWRDLKYRDKRELAKNLRYDGKNGYKEDAIDKFLEEDVTLKD